MAAPKLTERQRRFADELLKNPNATAAAIAAGYSENGAGQQGHELMQHEGVKAYLAERTGKLVAVNEATVDRITKELASIGFSDLRGIFTDDGKLKPPAQWPDELARCIASIKTSRRHVGIKAIGGDEPGDPDQLVEEAELITEIKLWPKVQALELLARYRKMLTDGVNLNAGERQVFVGMQVTVAPGATANIQVNSGKGDA